MTQEHLDDLLHLREENRQFNAALYQALSALDKEKDLRERVEAERDEAQEQVLKLIPERDAALRQLELQQAECHTIRRAYLHEKWCRENERGARSSRRGHMLPCCE